MSKYWSDLVSRLDPYVPGEQPKIAGLIKLNTNENPYPPSPKVADVFASENLDSLRLYPDPNSLVLKEAIANTYALKSEQVFVGNGSDEVLALAFQAFFEQQEPLLYPDITYSFYPVYCNLYAIETEVIPLADDFTIDINDYQRPNGGVIFPNPNAPTGIAMPLGQVEALLQANTEKVVLVDEAYIDFGGETAAVLVDRYPNLLVVQTLSKSRSLAGLRVGFALGHKDLIEGLDRVKNSFNSYPVDRVAEMAAVAALKDKAYFEACCQKIINTRERVAVELIQLGFDVLPSKANFLMAKPAGIDAELLFAQLREQKILVRYFNKPRIGDYLRITVGTDEEMQLLLIAIKEILAKA